MERPILFNTQMVSVILNGQKTQTRRLVKSPYKSGPWAFRINRCKETGEITGVEEIDEDLCGTGRYIHPPCKTGDFLYVRETWAPLYADMTSKEIVGYLYKVDRDSAFGDEYAAAYDEKYPEGKDWMWEGRWRPSIHMPKEAARLWLKVTNVHIERLSDMSDEDYIKEGVSRKGHLHIQFAVQTAMMCSSKEDRMKCWKGNPYVWVIEFERVENPENKEEAK